MLMLTCHIYNKRGLEVAKVYYEGAPLPPDTEGTVTSFGDIVEGFIKSPHGERQADFYDSVGNFLGSTEGFAPYGERECWAEDASHQRIGVVKNGNEILRKTDYSFEVVGRIQSDEWTADAREGLRIASEARGRVVTPQLENLMQIKQRSLAGVAALLIYYV